MMEYRNESGQLHRTDGTAFENDFIKMWYINGEPHRVDGPAVEYKDGHREWYLNGKLHREYGPAIEYRNGDKSWHLNNIKYSEEEYKQELIKLKLKRLIEL